MILIGYCLPICYHILFGQRLSYRRGACTHPSNKGGKMDKVTYPSSIRWTAGKEATEQAVCSSQARIIKL